MLRQLVFIIIAFICEPCFSYDIKDMVVNPWPSRHKRALIFPEGDNYIQYILGIGLPIELHQQSVTIGSVVKCTYRVPNNSTYFTRHYVIDDLRKKRTVTSNRWNIYEILSRAAESFGLGGKACVLQAICETAETPFRNENGLFEELLHTILTPSTTTEFLLSYADNEYLAAENLGRTGSDCKALFPECEINLLDIYTKII